MKKITLAVIGMSILADGSAALLTKPSATNPSPNGVHKLNAGQLNRIATRAIGFGGPMGVLALKQAIAVSAGGAKLTIDTEDVKAGDVWENKATGETGQHTKDYTKYSNHEVELGFAATMSILNQAVTAGISQMSQAPVAVSAPVARKPLGIAATDTTDSVDTTGSDTVEP